MDHQYSESLQEMNRARAFELESDADNTVDWLYSRATCIRHAEEDDTQAIIQAYQLFLSKNPPDDRKVPRSSLLYSDADATSCSQVFQKEEDSSSSNNNSN